MHELSIASSLINICLEKAAENNAAKIINVKIKIGKLSGVEVHYLKEAFDVVKAGTLAENCSFEYILQDIVVFCEACQKESVLKENIFKCPLCQNKEIQVIDGEDLFLMNLEFEK
ncbi:MAG: hydrogenase maturation nickel metallochaperone HypA [Spirochaetia bacterium]|nr:hydrogenase maturation nickel metallochaperone HypA [Spirochaetia bacterium]